MTGGNRTSIPARSAALHDHGRLPRGNREGSSTILDLLYVTVAGRTGARRLGRASGARASTAPGPPTRRPGSAYARGHPAGRPPALPRTPRPARRSPRPTGSRAPPGTTVPRPSWLVPSGEFAAYPGPERVPQPFPRLLVGAQRQAKLLLRVHEQFLVDDRRQDRPRQQVADVIRAPGQDPLVRDVLARLFDPFPVRAEPRRRGLRGRPVRRRMPLPEQLRGRGYRRLDRHPGGGLLGGDRLPGEVRLEER